MMPLQDFDESRFKVVNGTLPGISRTEWLYPKDDQATLEWWFKHGLLDVDPALEMMRPHLRDTRICIQAGGAVGVWPLRLAQVFDWVYTFEPELTNCECLFNNIQGVHNIFASNEALGRELGTASMRLEDKYIGHCGAWNVVPGNEVGVVSLDEFCAPMSGIDLIYLDIEGSEYDALMGATQTIRKHKPVIGMEDKGLNRRYNNGASPVTLLQEEFGYKILGKPCKTDVILVP